MSFVKRQNNDISVVHCLLDQENLVAKEIKEDLAIVFEEVVTVVNYIKFFPQHIRLFRVLCNEMGTEHNEFLFHSNVCWLSQGKVLERVANLRYRISIFLKEQKHDLVDRFSENILIAKLLFLADFFSHVNQLNGTIQEKQRIFLDVAESFNAFKAKMKLQMHRMETGKLAAFPALNLFVEEKNIDLRGICPIFFEHLTTFVYKLDRYIPSQNYSLIFSWVRTLFEVSTLEVHSQMDCIAEQLIQPQS